MARLGLAAALVLCALAPGQASEHRANPVRKVVTMLQNMKQQVKEEGEKEKKAYEEFACYCKTGASTLETSMEASRGKIEALESKIKGEVEKKGATDAALKEHTASRAEAKDQMAKATALRTQQSTAFMKLKSDADTNISAIAAAVAAIEKGMGASFLQSSSANLIRTYAMEKANMRDADRQHLLAFLSSAASYAPKSGEITGILKEMGDEMGADLLAATKAEEDAKATYDAMMSAKTKEVTTLTAQIEEEMMRLGELSVLIAEDTNDLEETKDTLGEDTIYLAELQKGCATKDAEWEARCKVRAEELVALAETIKVLNDDDSLEIQENSSRPFRFLGAAAGGYRSHALPRRGSAEECSAQGNGDRPGAAGVAGKVSRLREGT
ncbi:unnamed protein product [Prorocentrum cordatum]|uniref:Uncharacterized protein n=1 Tax=Prorocentrum cordatum TaxID=2364126 RepID=A0ABN9U9C6_9DINO|nr:unnamed protein product [Polarella glacialis]